MPGAVGLVGGSTPTGSRLRRSPVAFCVLVLRIQSAQHLAVLGIDEMDLREVPVAYRTSIAVRCRYRLGTSKRRAAITTVPSL